MWTIVVSEWSLCFIEKVQVEFGAVCIIFYFRQACRPRDSRADAANQILHYWDVRGFLKLAIINTNDRLPEPRVWRIQYTTLSHIVRIFRIMQQISCRTVWQKCAAWIKNINTFLHCLGLFEPFMAVELFAEVARHRKELISMPDFRTQTNLAHSWTNKTQHTVRSSHPTAPVCVTPSGSAEPSGSLPGGSRPLRSGTELWSSSPPSEALSGSTLSHARSWPAPSAAGRLGGGEATTKR